MANNHNKLRFQVHSSSNFGKSMALADTGNTLSMVFRSRRISNFLAVLATFLLCRSDHSLQRAAGFGIGRSFSVSRKASSILDERFLRKCAFNSKFKVSHETTETGTRNGILKSLSTRDGDSPGSSNLKNVNTESDLPRRDSWRLQLKSFLRIGIPSAIAGVVATYAFPFLALTLASIMNDGGVFAVLSQDSSQFVQNFLTVAGLLFSILVGQTYYFMYQQQEYLYYSLFNEVTEAKSLLEQVALVCQGRTRLYHPILKFIRKYVKEDLKQLKADPAVLLSARPVDDPLESIMYMTSVGVPSMIYDTVRSLRQARAARLGALQRKLPKVHMWLLWLLAVIELCSFPLLGAGTQTIGGYNILTVEGCLFGVMTSSVVMTLMVVGELWRPAGGAYNVDNVLSVMVRGLEDELDARLSGKSYASYSKNPLPQFPMDNTRAFEEIGEI